MTGQGEVGHTGLERVGIDYCPRESLPSWVVSIHED